MTVIARTDVYQVETQSVGTLVTRLEDGATLYLQPGENETLFLDSVFGICLPEEVSADSLDSSIDDYAEQFVVQITAQDYANRYRTAFETGGLTQGGWHVERDGRQLACALGVIGDDVDGPSKCPAQIMPRWLAQMVPAFFDQQEQDSAFAWGLDFTAELARLNGNIPFIVIHDWHANVVCPLGIEAAEIAKRDTAPHKALQGLHSRALAGEKISADDWRPVLKNAYANAYANANANANANAYTNANAYADAYAYADANANAYAYAYAYAYANAYTKRQEAWSRLAVGMTECLKRVEVA